MFLNLSLMALDMELCEKLSFQNTESHGDFLAQSITFEMFCFVFNVKMSKPSLQRYVSLIMSVQVFLTDSLLSLFLSGRTLALFLLLLCQDYYLMLDTGANKIKVLDLRKKEWFAPIGAYGLQRLNPLRSRGVLVIQAYRTLE